ncbi:MAG: hypothetical protein JXR69_07115, partial [Candidatus Delongbacteria bacterium]|nr:hypothetical protein [Candidatus Delongbacteria bacterium]
ISINFISCEKNETISKRSSLDEQLDSLENMIVKYEELFKETAYGTQEYTDVVNSYNKEVGGWSSVFEVDRYNKGEDGKRVPTEDFKKVEKRFIELNSRMTRMILSTIPKKDPEPDIIDDRK